MVNHLLSSVSVAASVLMAARHPEGSGFVVVDERSEVPRPEPEMSSVTVTPTYQPSYSITYSSESFVLADKTPDRPKNQQPFYMSVPKRKRGRKRH